MILIIAIIYNFSSNVLFNQQLKITFRKSSGPPEKIHSPLQIQKLQVPPPPALFAKIEKILDPLLQKGGEDTVCLINLL